MGAAGDKEAAIEDAAGYELAEELKVEIKDMMEFSKLSKGGRLYRADIGDENFVGWNKPLTEHPEGSILPPFRS